MNKALGTLPADLVALLSRRGPSSTNEARPFERLGAAEASRSPIESAIEPWLSFATGRRSWVRSHRGRVQATVSARRRGGRRAWEIDGLADTTADLRCLPRLLDDGTAEAGRGGAEKIFVRVASDSDAVPVLRAAGFVPYASELLYECTSAILQGHKQSLAGLREMSQQDVYPAFRLYSSCFPEPRRRLEGATFDEWQASRETRWVKSGVQLVLEGEGQLAGTVRAAVAPQGLLTEITLASPTPEVVGGVLAAAMPLGGDDISRILCLAAENSGLHGVLQDLGFTGHSKYISLVCRTTQVVRLGHRVSQLPRTAVVT